MASANHITSGRNRFHSVAGDRLAPCLALFVLFIRVAAAAPETGEHGHLPLAVDTTLSLSTVVDMTLDNYPATLEFGARKEEAEAWTRLGHQFTAGQPALSLRYQTDRFGDDAGLEEIETGIQFALWKWGQRKATQELGEALDAESDAAFLALRWQVTGLVRELVWQMARASGELTIAEESASIAESLAEVIRRRQELGDAAVRDVLLADSAQLDAEAQLIEAEVALVDAERAYTSLTGLARRPTYRAEDLTERTVVESSHPALGLITAGLDRARSRQSLARQTGMNPPTLTLGPRRERSTFDQRYEDSIGLIVTVPFGGGSQARTRAAEAGRDVAAAQAALRQARRDLDLLFHEAAHGLEVARENLELARKRADLSERGFRIGESAYAKGELSLIELLTLQRVLLDARRQALQFEIEEKRQTALYNQALGVMP